MTTEAENGAAAERAPEPPAPEWEAELDVYPLRPASEDPRWAVVMVWIWVGFTFLSIGFIVWLLILGAMYPGGAPS